MRPNDDFTYETYQRLLETAIDAGYEFLTVREYLRRATLPRRFVVLRHDVDRKPENAVDVARIEADLGVPSTYYFRTIPTTFTPEMMATIESLGHEVGYHYEDLDRAAGDVELAHTLFRHHLDKVRTVVDRVDTVCMHGNPLSPHDNRDMWGEDPDFERYDLLGEAYLSMDFEDVAYFSDTGRTWQDGALKIKDHTMGEGEKRVQADTTEDLIALMGSGRVSRACLLSHPNRWAGSYPELAAEWTKDTLINAVKRGYNIVT